MEGKNVEANRTNSGIMDKEDGVSSVKVLDTEKLPNNFDSKIIEINDGHAYQIVAKSDTETSGSEIKIQSDDESDHKIIDDHSCEPDDKVEKSRQTTKEILSKRSGRKRRSVKDKLPESEGNYLDDDTDNPLNMLEIRSAAQWRSISQRISLSVDREPDNNRVGRSRKSGKVSLSTHFTYHLSEV